MSPAQAGTGAAWAPCVEDQGRLGPHEEGVAYLSTTVTRCAGGGGAQSYPPHHQWPRPPHPRYLGIKSGTQRGRGLAPVPRPASRKSA